MGSSSRYFMEQQEDEVAFVALSDTLHRFIVKHGIEFKKMIISSDDKEFSIKVARSFGYRKLVRELYETK